MSSSDHTRYASDRLETRQIDELIGLARGLIADGVINQAEVEFLQKWLAANRSVIDHPVLKCLYDRTRAILADGILDEAEKAELFDTLHKFTNGNFELGEALKATTLPLCNPPPHLSFQGLTYCFTGTFNYGQRKHCEKAIADRGGFTSKNPTRSTDVLVVGIYATESWKHSSFGNKIALAAEMREAGARISIVSEEHWVRFL